MSLKTIDLNLAAQDFLNTIDISSILTEFDKKPDEAFASHAYSANSSFSIQPRGGVGRLSKQYDLMRNLLHAGADFLPITVDSHSRLGEVERASAILQSETIHDKNILNGFPINSHTLSDVKWLTSSFNKPICLRHGTPHPLNLFRSALKGGVTEFEGGVLSYVIPYSRNADLTRAIEEWSVVEQITGYINQNGIGISRESFGPLSATLVPPLIIVLTQLVELTLSWVCGVKSYTVTLPELHNHSETILCKVIIEDCIKDISEILEQEISVYFGLHQWMGAFPQSYINANALIATSAAFAAKFKFDKLITKTSAEAFRIPTADDNMEAIRLVKYVREQTPSVQQNYCVIDDEYRDILKKNVMSILDHFFLIARRIVATKANISDLQQEILNLFHQGQIDIPFAPHEMNKNKLITCMDLEGCIRIYDPGCINLSKDLIKFERDKVQKRLGNGSLSEAIQKDIYCKC